jgi:hypothetical protein
VPLTHKCPDELHHPTTPHTTNTHVIVTHSLQCVIRSVYVITPSPRHFFISLFFFIIIFFFIIFVIISYSLNIMIFNLFVQKLENFTWEVGVTPFSSLQTPIIASLLYLFTIYLIPRIMKHRSPMKFPYLLSIHNLTLSVLSLVMFTMIAFHLIKHVWRSGWHTLYCDEGKVLEKGPLVFWYCIFEDDFHHCYSCCIVMHLPLLCILHCVMLHCLFALRHTICTHTIFGHDTQQISSISASSMSLQTPTFSFSTRSRSSSCIGTITSSHCG